MKYARIIDGNVLEIIQPPAGYSIHDCYHKDIVDACRLIPANLDVAIGWTYSPESGFVAPAPAPAPEPEPTPDPTAAPTSAPGG